MRITNNMMVNNFLINLNKNLSRLDDIQYKMATGKKIRYPSDDPVVTARSLRLRTDVSEIEQLQKNVDDAISWVDITESALADITENLQRVRELTVRGANGTNTKEDMAQIAKEVAQIKQHIIQVGNTNYAGRYIFSGFKTDTAPINPDGSFSDTGSFTSSGGYPIDLSTGNNIIQFELMKANYIGINKTANQIFYIQGEADENKGNLFKVLDNLINALESGDVNTVNSLLSNIDRHIDNVVAQRGDVGALQNRLELIKNRLSDDNVNFTTLLSNNEDVDMAEIIMQLKTAENVYRAALQTGAQILPPTLLDFLRF
ncbi:flagellar hook-associated protein 3 [Caldicellulosiruptor owensensis OL]|uniref:Flagellar hook-associated protein 3 n=1 Tax=Caldicellulosiruptor owensensis (strain ATCC 700167 / DSM 13100 / OL) TaxID=632518 RepID=E4Q2U4_CALOW|nr:flagellar hook-associated protein FlgL [Caldicellulosiruptor owensensis]ADQ04962.1 flagellar hook-associated protein 3 [Caldicellulosiruptor owensensis OL]